jgi:hypothetical protein
MKKKSCGSSIKHTCSGNLQYATCVQYELPLPEFSELGDCVSIEETTEELYNLIGEIKEETDLSELANECLEYVLEEGKVIVKNVLLKHEQEICELKEKVEQLENRQLCEIPISSCNINLDCLTLPCDQSIATLEDLLNAMITKICETE